MDGGSMTSGFYAIDGDSLLYGPTTVWLPDGQILSHENPPSEPVAGWQWFDSEDAARIAYGLPLVERARDERGRFLPDDLTTPDVNEAWVPS